MAKNYKKLIFNTCSDKSKLSLAPLELSKRRKGDFKMNKLVLFIAVFLGFQFAAYGNSTRQEFNCMNGDTVVIKSSLQPSITKPGTFERVFSGVLTKADEDKGEGLIKKECADLEEKWKSFGAENCYETKDGASMFSYFKKSGSLLINVENTVYYTLCSSEESVQ